jgi:CO/xanthine dehydrogenase FAD-binding subunit
MENDMVDVRYEAPRSISEAVRIAGSSAGAKFIAGGTDLLVQVRNGATQPAVYVDIKRIPELIGLTLDASGLRIGAATPAAVVCENAEVRKLWPGLLDGTGLIGSTQIQGRGSIGGNLCNSSPAADSVCGLIINEARCVIAGPKGERTVPVEQFNTGPGKNVLQPGELLVALFLPRPQARSADAYLRMIPRTEMDIAVVGAGVRVTLDAAGTCTAARVAIGAVAPTALLVPEAAAALVGSKIDAVALAKAAAAASAAAHPISDKRGSAEYRRKIVGVMTRRAAAIAAQRAQGGK